MVASEAPDSTFVVSYVSGKVKKRTASLAVRWTAIVLVLTACAAFGLRGCLTWSIRAERARLIEAVISGDAPRLDGLLNGMNEPDQRDENGVSLLHLAVLNSDIRTTAVLVDHGAAANVRDANGMTPLMVAARQTDVRLVRLLVNQGADPKLIDHHGRPTLCWALNPGGTHGDPQKPRLEKKQVSYSSMSGSGISPAPEEIVPLISEMIGALVKKGASPDAADRAGLTPLIYAVNLCRAELVTALLDLGADPNLADLEGTTPLIWAVGTGRKDVVKALLRGGARPQDRDQTGHTAADYARNRRADYPIRRPDEGEILKLVVGTQ